MSINTEIEKAFTEVKTNIDLITLWRDYDYETFSKIERLDRMRNRVFELQQALEQLLSAIIREGGEAHD